MKTILTLTILLILGLSNCFATEFKFIGFVKVGDIDVEIGDYRKWVSPPSSYWEMDIKVRGESIHTYKTGINSSVVFGNDGSFLKSLEKLKQNINQEVLLILPEKLSHEDMITPFITPKPDEEKGFLKKKGNLIGVFNPSIHNITFSNVGPIYHRGGSVSLEVNGHKVITIDGFGFNPPKSKGYEEGSIEEIYNDHLLGVNSEDQRIFMYIDSVGFFRIIEFTPQTLEIE